MTRKKKLISSIVIPCTAITLLALAPKPQLPNLWPVLRVIDGATIVLRYYDRKEQVRLLGINPPERGRYGSQEAMKAMKNLVGGCKVFLEFDGTGKNKRDRYGRLLAYIFHDGHNINVEMVRLGWSEFWTKYGKGKYAREFYSAQQEAKRTKRGLWKPEDKK